MNQFFLDVRSREKLKELRREGISGQELRRLGISAGPMSPQSAGRVTLAILLLGILWVSTALAASVTAAPLTVRSVGMTCVSSRPVHPMGLDGGLTGMSRGEVWIDVAPSSMHRPAGVDGGLLTLRFAGDARSSLAANRGSGCATSSAGT